MKSGTRPRGRHGTQRAKELLRLGVGAAVEEQRNFRGGGVLATVAVRQFLYPADHDVVVARLVDPVDRAVDVPENPVDERGAR